MIKTSLLAGIAAISLGAAAPAPAADEKVDILIRGGTVYTGSDAPFVGDVAIRGDKVVLVGKKITAKADHVIDAKGMIVSPGFIDTHTHMGADLQSDEQAKRLLPAFLMQGVTTAFIGNDGGGNYKIDEVLGSAKTKPVGVNYAAYVGLGPVRSAVIGADDRAPTAAELERMKGMVATAMCQGAVGFSTGLFYSPQSFAKRDEVVALAAEAGKRGGTYDSHIRDESSYNIGLAAAIDEAMEVGRLANMPTHIAHIKALGVDVHGQSKAIIAKIEAAQAAGMKVTADQYPWSASGTSLFSALIPLWAQDGGRPALLKRFADASQTERLREGITENMRKRGGADKLLIVGGQYRNRYLSDVAKERGEDPVTATIEIIKIADARTVSFNQDEGDIKTFMARPWVMTGSDASDGHPRIYGSFARKYDKYVVNEKAISLRDFIERSTALPAKTFNLVGRGKIAKGSFADITIFDPKSFASKATYESPAELAVGVRNVVVNGVLAVSDGKVTGAAGGRALAKTPPAGSCI